jgi:mono/diheme cytochrome c family protein
MVSAPRATRRGRPTLAISLALLLGAGCTPLDDLVANLAVERSMRIQPAIEPYEVPMLLPAENTVPFASGNFAQGPGLVNLGQPEFAVVPPPVTPIQILTQSIEATGVPNPVASDAASLARGEVLFLRACSPCHGAGGAGDGPVSALGIPPTSLLTAQAIGYADGFIYNMIRYGRGAMPSYAHQIPHFDRWNVVNYVRQLQSAAAPAAVPAAAAPPAQP